MTTEGPGKMKTEKTANRSKPIIYVEAPGLPLQIESISKVLAECSYLLFI